MNKGPHTLEESPDSYLAKHKGSSTCEIGSGLIWKVLGIIFAAIMIISVVVLLIAVVMGLIVEPWETLKTLGEILLPGLYGALLLILGGAGVIGLFVLFSSKNFPLRKWVEKNPEKPEMKTDGVIITHTTIPALILGVTLSYLTCNNWIDYVLMFIISSIGLYFVTFTLVALGKRAKQKWGGQVVDWKVTRFFGGIGEVLKDRFYHKVCRVIVVKNDN